MTVGNEEAPGFAAAAPVAALGSCGTPWRYSCSPKGHGLHMYKRHGWRFRGGDWEPLEHSIQLQVFRSKESDPVLGVQDRPAIGLFTDLDRLTIKAFADQDAVALVRDLTAA